MIVKDRMTKNPVTVHPDTPVADARGLMKQEKIHRLPVVGKRGDLVGIVTEKDILYASPSPASTLDVYEMTHLLSKLTVSKVMTKAVITIEENATVEDAARIMIDSDIGGLPVTRGESLVGIITESDLFRIFTELFGARVKGIRATVLIPERRGELADIAAAITRKGGNFISFGTFLGEDQTNALCTLKVEGITKGILIDCLEPYVQEVLDIREV